MTFRELDTILERAGYSFRFDNEADRNRDSEVAALAVHIEGRSGPVTLDAVIGECEVWRPLLGYCGKVPLS